VNHLILEHPVLYFLLSRKTNGYMRLCQPPVTKRIPVLVVGQQACDTKCPPGYECPDSNSKVKCGKGYFSAEGVSTCSPCSDGYYAKVEGGSSLFTLSRDQGVVTTLGHRFLSNSPVLHSHHSLCSCFGCQKIVIITISVKRLHCKLKDIIVVLHLFW